MKLKRDEPLEEIWAIRRKIAAECSFDPKELGDFYRRSQKAAGVKLYRRKKRLPAAK